MDYPKLNCIDCNQHEDTIRCLQRKVDLLGRMLTDVLLSLEKADLLKDLTTKWPDQLKIYWSEHREKAIYDFEAEQAELERKAQIRDMRQAAIDTLSFAQLEALEVPKHILAAHPKKKILKGPHINL